MPKIDRDHCLELDRVDPLGPLRARFHLEPGVVYLDGNSLGALPRATGERLARVIAREWGDGLIRSWTQADWIGAPARVGDKIGRLIGAAAGQVIAADSTSVNLFKLIVAAMRLRRGRSVILTEIGNFPTDLYVAQGVADLLDGRARVRMVAEDEIEAALDQDVAILMLTHVNYKSGRIHDMARLTRAAHDAGALVLWDLAHSAGALAVDLDGVGADLAVGCGYKYLNGGPGAPAFAYVAKVHQTSVVQPLWGWLGHAQPFAFDTDYRPAAGIAQMLCGTPPILAMSALESALDLWLEVDMGAVRKKSQALGDLFVALVDARLGAFGFTLVSPRDAEARGSQVSIAHAEGYPIMQALIQRGVIGDFRAPDVLRFGFTPLYTRYVDIWDALEALREVMASGGWDTPELKVRAAVT